MKYTLADHASDWRWRASVLSVHVSNARHRATRPLRTASGSLRNWRNRRFLETGKGFRVERATRGLRSSLPVYRNRINRATGRPRRDDAEVYRRRDEAFARMRERRIPRTAAVQARDYAPAYKRGAPQRPGRSR
jgi:hypothetical protein